MALKNLTTTILPLLLGALWAAPAAASGSLTGEERARLAEPRRGLYAEFDFGSLMFLGEGGVNVDPGILTGIGIGSDISPNVQVGVHVWAATNKSALPPSNPPPPDAHSLLVLGHAKILYPSGPRFNWTARINAGVMSGTPKPSRLLSEFDPDLHQEDPTGGTNSPVVGAGLGLEYYTRLRHFSIGAEAAVDYVIGPGGLALRLYPVIKYTF